MFDFYEEGNGIVERVEYSFNTNHRNGECPVYKSLHGTSPSLPISTSNGPSRVTIAHFQGRHELVEPSMSAKRDDWAGSWNAVSILGSDWLTILLRG